ncbi:MAG: two-component sensor histidine kinase [Desulfarculus sp.]|nr:two-component sensor histidine kinase [Desulfarculus sp.]
MTKPYSQLARRMTITALLVTLMPLYFLGAVIYFYFDFAHNERAKEELRTLAGNRASAIQVFLAERTALLEVLAHSATLEDLIKPGRLQQVFSLLNRRSWTFLDLGIVDNNGDHRVYVGPYPLEHQNYKDAHWFQEVMTRGVYVSDVFLGRRGVPHFVIAVKHNHDQKPWVLRATIDSDVFTKLVQRAQVGSGGDAYIINRDGQYQTPPRFGGPVLDASGLDVKSVPPGVSVQERLDKDSNKRQIAFAWLPKEDWLLVIEQNPHERVGAMSLARNMEMAVLGLGSLLIVGVVLFLVKVLVRQLEAADRQRADQDAQLVHSARLVSLGRMAAGVAHEINNPLAAIGELAGLMDDLMDEEFVKTYSRGSKFKENVAKIQHHVDRARGVTHRLLGFARRMEPHHDSVEVNDIVNETCSFLEKEALFRKVDLGRELAVNLPRIKSDRAQLQQVFLNLLNNALDAVGEGGHITLTSRLNGDFVEVSVADDGPGIPPDLRERIFDPFFTTKGPGQGTGLGLSISHSIMQRLGGSLTFESQPGHGATFLVRIPKVLAE